MIIPASYHTARVLAIVVPKEAEDERRSTGRIVVKPAK
jgi:hypothetical protein